MDGFRGTSISGNLKILVSKKAGKGGYRGILLINCMVYDDIGIFITVPNRNWDYHNP